MTPFQLKVSDLLHDIWSQDTHTFTNIKTSLIPWLTDEGITVTISLQSLNTTTILIQIEQLHCVIHEMCDKSAEMYDRVVDTAGFTGRCMLSTQRIYEDPLDDDIYDINDKSETIDLEEFIMQAVLDQEPIVHVSPAYLAAHPEIHMDAGDAWIYDDDDIWEYPTSQQWVVFQQSKPSK